MKLILTTILVSLVLSSTTFAQIKDPSFPLPTPNLDWMDRKYTSIVILEQDGWYGFNQGKLQYDKKLVKFTLPQEAIDLVMVPLQALEDELDEALPEWAEAIINEYLSYGEGVDTIQARLKAFQFGFQGKALREVADWQTGTSTTLRINKAKWRWFGVGFAIQSPRASTQNPFLLPQNIPSLVTFEGIGKVSLQNAARTDRGSKAVTVYAVVSLHQIMPATSSFYEWTSKKGKARSIAWRADVAVLRSYDPFAVGLEFFVNEDAVAQLTKYKVPPFLATSAVNYVQGKGLPTIGEALKEMTLWGIKFKPRVYLGGDGGGLTLGGNFEYLFRKGISISSLGINISYVKTVDFLELLKKKNKD